MGSRHKRKRRVGPPWRRPEGLFPPFLDAFPSHLSRSLAFLPPFSPFLPPNPLPLAAKKYAMPRAAATTTGTVAQPKQRKPRAPPSKPPGMTNAEWRAEFQRREAVTTDRRNRAIAKKARDNTARAASAASADQAEAEATRVGMMNPPGSHA